MYDNDFTPLPETLSPPPPEQVPAPKSDEAGLAAPRLPSEGGSDCANSALCTQNSALPQAPKRKHRRNGTVARLPNAVPDQLNQMLLDGFPYRQIIEKLGDSARELKEEHIGEWKKGGHEDWLIQQERADDLGATREAALSLVKEKAGATVQDAARTIASAQLYELLLSFDPRNFTAALPEKPELYFRLINSLARLSEGEAVCSRLRAQAAALERELQTGQPGETPGVISAEKLKEIIRLIKLL